MTVGFDRTADCQGNHPSLTEFLRILTEHYWLCFDRTTSLTEHLGNLGFDRTVNGEMFCQKNVISRVSCHKHFDIFSDRPYPDFSSTSFGRTTRVNVRPYRTEPYRTKFGKLVWQSS